MIGAPHRLSLWACTSQVVVLAGCAPLAPSAAIASGNIKIVSSRPRIGGVKTQTDTIANAIPMALSEVNSRVGDATITFLDLDDATVAKGNRDAAAEAANANTAMSGRRAQDGRFEDANAVILQGPAD